MKKFDDELNEFISSIESHKEEIMKSQKLVDEKEFKGWCKNVVKGTRTFKSLFSVEIVIRFRDTVIVDFVIPKQS